VLRAPLQPSKPRITDHSAACSLVAGNQGVNVNSPLSYIGGKSKLSKNIIGIIPEHRSYCEVFAGALWVFFRKEPSSYEMINDLDGNLVTFYRVLQNHLEEFLKQFKWLLVSHEWWDDWTRQLEAGGLTDIQKAARYYYLQRLCFGGRVKGRTWGYSVDHAPRINLFRLEEELSMVHLRLSKVVIENRNWMDFIKKYDKATTFFYIDPPYFNCPFYAHNLYKIDEYKLIADTLKNLSGKFILSINDVPEMVECFSCFKFKKVSVGYSSGKKRTVGKELIIRNFD
jgi:DNA adenine methylase